MSNNIDINNNMKQDDSWERDTINKLLFSTIKEQRSKRLWGIFFKTIGFGYLIVMTILMLFGTDLKITKDSKIDHTAMIRIEGAISEEQSANAEDINIALKNAFNCKQTKGVVLKINSPGGSPVQARQVYRYISKLKSEHPTIKIYAAIEDLGTSAAYLIASAANEIYADETSLVGSIGVVMNGFGFVDTLHKLGIERRIYTAGKNKVMLDPFSPKNPEHEAFILQQLELIHKTFIQDVINQRPKLSKKSENEELFSGKFWVGQDALKLGLIDGFGDIEHIAANVVKATEIRDFTLKPSILERFSSKFKLMLKLMIANLVPNLN